MKALVISGGGSKGAYAGGVAEHLIHQQKKQYDLFIGSSTGSLLLPHLALNNIPKIKQVYTTIEEKKVFSRNPFKVRTKNKVTHISINYINTLIQFLLKRKTFGESKNLRHTIARNFSREEFHQLQDSDKEVVVSVSNLSRNRVEYKSIKEYEYQDFLDWIWISCNVVPFMTLKRKNDCDYADGGLANTVPISQAIARGAKEIDAIVLETEDMDYKKLMGSNPFSLMINLYDFMVDQTELHDIREGKLAAKNNNVKLNLYFTPDQLTENSLIFDRQQMLEWWRQGYEHAEKKSKEQASNKIFSRWFNI